MAKYDELTIVAHKYIARVSTQSGPGAAVFNKTTIYSDKLF